MMTEEERFRQAVPASMRAVNAMAEHLRVLGYEVRVNHVSVRPHFDQRAGYGDTEDLLARLSPAELWDRFEIKGRTFEFTCYDDFPHPTIIVDRAEKADHSRADWYVNVSKSLRYAAAMSSETRAQWSRRTVFDTVKGYEATVYECPKALAIFLKLRISSS